MRGCLAESGRWLTGGTMKLMIMVVGAGVLTTPASAEPLHTVWTLVPISAIGPKTVDFGEVFLEQRIFPLAAVKVLYELRYAPNKAVPSGTILFYVANDNGQVAYCTAKDRSSGNVAKSLFIPMLDKRPCFVDTNGDGKFDAWFSVFDKYGSALTPSGSIAGAKPITPVSYEQVDPRRYPVDARMSFKLRGSHKVDKADIEVSFNNGAGYSVGVAQLDRSGNRIGVVNLTVTIESIDQNRAAIDIQADARRYMLGDSGGSFYGVSAASVGQRR